MLRGLFLTAVLFVSTAAANDIGKIENSAGGAVVLREGKVLPTTAGTILQLNDIVRTEKGGLLRLVLNDGSALLVDESTELRVVSFDPEQQQTLVEMLHGHILAEVAPYTKPSGRFVIKTPTASVIALGTTVEVATTPATETVTARQLETLPGPNGQPLTIAQTALAVSLELKPMRANNSLGQPAQPTSLLDIPPGAKVGGPGVWLGNYSGVGRTFVASLDHFVVTTNADPSIPGMTFLVPGQGTVVPRNEAPIRAFSSVDWVAKQDLQLGSDVITGRYFFNRGNTFGSGSKDFGVNGQPCTPGVVVNGQAVSGAPSYQYKILGMGGSTGNNALQIAVKNQGPCPLYFFVPAGTGVRPKGFNKVGKAILGLALGSGLPNLKEFQDMSTFGLFLIVRPAGALGAGPAAPTGGEVTVPMRSYCVELHKLAPHPQTEYKFANEDDQKKFAGDLPVMQRAAQLYQTRQLPSTMGHGLDSIIQWSLWAKIEKMGQKQFMEEFTKLVHKNYVAKKQKWDKDTQKKVEASGQELWKLTQIVLK